MGIEVNDQGLVDDGIYGAELRSDYSYLRYGYEPNTHTFYLYNIGTPNPDDRNKGHSKVLLKAFFQTIKQYNGILNVGNYTKSGESYIKPVVDRLSREYGVRLV